MSLQLIVFVLAFICFTLAAFRVPAGVDWTNAGFALVTLGAFIL